MKMKEIGLGVEVTRPRMSSVICHWTILLFKANTIQVSLDSAMYL